MKRRGAFAAIAIALGISLVLPSFHAEARDEFPKPTYQSNGPLLILVSLRKQRLRVFDVAGEVASSRVSSGMPGFDTPTGVYAVIEKDLRHYSNIYSGAPMPYMQRITWSGIALHSGVVPGYRASHGCIRLPDSFARSLYSLTKPGVRVVVSQDETQPLPFSHPRLFRPLPESVDPEVATASIDTRLASNDAGPAPEAMTEFKSILGVTPALAAAVAEWKAEPERPLTRADADRKVSERMTNAAAAVKLATSQRLTSLEAIKTTSRAADAAAAKLSAARKTADPGAAKARDAEARLVAARAAFLAAMREPVTLGPLEAEDRESNLETAILDASDELSEARAGVARGELEMAALEADARSTERARVEANAAARKAEYDLKNAQAQVTEATKDAARRSKPLSVLISLRAERIYVRQGFEPVFEAPIRLDEPPRKIGTYVLTAMQYDRRNPDSFDWRLVTAQPPSFAEPPRRNRQYDDRDDARASGSAAAVLSASLDNLKIPDEIVAMISERARPGASLIITDRELKADENGSNTEFVLQTR